MMSRALDEISTEFGQAFSSALFELRTGTETWPTEEYVLRGTVLRNAVKYAWDHNKVEMNETERRLLGPVLDAIEEYYVEAFWATESTRPNARPRPKTDVLIDGA